MVNLFHMAPVVGARASERVRAHQETLTAGGLHVGNRGATIAP